MVKQEINISSAKGLIETLKHSDAGVRAALFREILEHPNKALSIGKESGFDLINELIFLCDNTHDNSIRLGYVYTLLNLKDERCIDFAKQEFLTTNDSDIILLSAQLIAKLPSHQRIELLTPVIMNTNNYTKCRAASNILAYNKDLTIKTALRVCILSDHKVEVPLLNKENLAYWLDELEGVYLQKTRRIILKNNLLSTLVKYFDKLSYETQVWSFQEAVKNDAQTYKQLIKKIILQEDRKKLLISALEALQYLSLSDVDEKMIEPFYKHEDEDIRFAAINAGISVLDWGLLFKDELSDKVRLAIITRIGKSKSIEGMNFLSLLLENENWRIRSCASNALVALAPSSLSVLNDLLVHENDLVYISAIQALKKLGMKIPLKDR